MSAEVGGGGDSRGKKGKKSHKKQHSTRIDMTPMVDLGFLLLTFFVLTTTMATPKSMPIVLPEVPKPDAPKPDKIAEGKVLHLLLDKDDKIYYYQGVAADAVANEGGAAEQLEFKQTNYSKDGIRKVIFEYRQKVDAKYGKNEMIILIKPTDVSRYKNVVDILDEMNITVQKKYALVEVAKEEIELIAQASGIAPVAPN
jgi:biopolymer transport protein ExbD